MTSSSKMTAHMLCIAAAAIVSVCLLAYGVCAAPSLVWIGAIGISAIVVISIPLLWHFVRIDQVWLAKRGKEFSDRVFAYRHDKLPRLLVRTTDRSVTYFVPVDDTRSEKALIPSPDTVSKGVMSRMTQLKWERDHRVPEGRPSAGFRSEKYTAPKAACTLPPAVIFLCAMRGGLTNIPTGIYFLENADASKDEPEYWKVAFEQERQPAPDEDDES